MLPGLERLPMLIERVGVDRRSGLKKWYASASGIDRDLYNERMSVELFKDFIERAQSGEQVPAPFSSDAWHGGMPYLGLAHYLDLDGAGIVGLTEEVRISGTNFKASGVFKDSELGQVCYRSIKSDIDQMVDPGRRVRISIAFIDWAHEHEGQGSFSRKALTQCCGLCEDGVADKIYRRGHLVHLALTRRPAYPKASISLDRH